MNSVKSRLIADSKVIVAQCEAAQGQRWQGFALGTGKGWPLGVCLGAS